MYHFVGIKTILEQDIVKKFANKPNKPSPSKGDDEVEKGGELKIDIEDNPFAKEEE